MQNEKPQTIEQFDKDHKSLYNEGQQNKSNVWLICQIFRNRVIRRKKEFPGTVFKFR